MHFFATAAAAASELTLHARQFESYDSNCLEHRLAHPLASSWYRDQRVKNCQTLLLLLLLQKPDLELTRNLIQQEFSPAGRFLAPNYITTNLLLQLLLLYRPLSLEKKPFADFCHQENLFSAHSTSFFPKTFFCDYTFFSAFGKHKPCFQINGSILSSTILMLIKVGKKAFCLILLLLLLLYCMSRITRINLPLFLPLAACMHACCGK